MKIKPKPKKPPQRADQKSELVIKTAGMQISERINETADSALKRLLVFEIVRTIILSLIQIDLFSFTY